MYKQIPVLIALFASTGAGYIYIGYLYSSLLPELLWYLVVLGVSFWGYKLYKRYRDNNLNIDDKEKWLNQLRYFLFTYFSLWTVIFILYTTRENVELHYIALATQLGSSVVSSAILVSQKKLVRITLISLMLPVMIYFILVDEFYSYLLAIFTFVLGGVLLYAANNTYNYLVKSQFQAYNDHLTKLGNRRYFIENLEDSIKVQKQNKNFIYLLLIDLDHFKTINDTLGHDIGDELLIEVAHRMRELSQKYRCEVSRLGGDEFCILSDFYTTKDECFNVALEFSNELLEKIKKSYKIDEHHLYISASVGVSIIDNPDMRATTFIKEADIAMYEAKAKGRDGVILFTDELAKTIEYKLDIERLLHFALKENEISLRYQPQINVNSEKLSCEVLARWNNRDLGFIPPDVFIPISEQTGIIIELGYYILEESFKTLKEWDEKGIELAQMAVNISMRQLFHNTFIDDVQKLCAKYLNEKLTAKIIFEITETSTAEDINLLIKTMEKLKKLGIHFSIDDFGTGYSSLSYLRQLPLDELKIDKSFINEIVTTKDGKKMVKTILDIAKNLNLSVVAEGVEKADQENYLISQNCDVLQGYYFSQPILKDEFESYILERETSQN